MTPSAPKPTIIIAQVAGSGTPGVTVTPSSRANGGAPAFVVPMARKDRVSDVLSAMKLKDAEDQPVKPWLALFSRAVDCVGAPPKPTFQPSCVAPRNPACWPPA